MRNLFKIMLLQALHDLSHRLSIDDDVYLKVKLNS